MNHVALNGSGTDNRHFNHQVIEVTRLHTREKRHLRPAFNLENADAVGPTQHVINSIVPLRHRGQRVGNAIMSFHELESLADAGQHAKAQHINFQNSQCINIILVPFDDGAVFHCRIFHRHDVIKS